LDTTVYTLVTTAHEETWPKDKPILFLGDWCVLYNRRHLLHNLDYVVHPYHWDDKKEKEKNHAYLKIISEKIFLQIVVKLNILHAVQYSERYWRILIGSWVERFVYILFDRWRSLSEALEAYQIDDLYMMDRDELDILDVISNFRVEDDEWNEVIYVEILKNIVNHNVNFKRVLCCKKPNLTKKSVHLDFRSTLIKIISIVTSKLPHKGDILFYEAHLPLMLQIKLQIKLGQFPYISCKQSNVVIRTKVNPKYRDWRNWLDIENDEFSHIISRIIPKFLPKEYLEGYSDMVSNHQYKKFPKYPKIILTGRRNQESKIENFWIASNVEKGIPLIILQHGGGYGVTRQTGYEKKEVDISDYFFSWGWHEKNRPSVIPVGNIRMSGKVIPSKEPEYALMIGLSLPRYANYPFEVIDTTFNDYFNDQITFFKSLSRSMRNKIVVKRYASGHKQFQKNRWTDSFSNVVFADDSKSVLGHMKDGCICICTYNSTAYLESLTLNVPTIIFWSGESVRESAKPHFERLKSAGIFYENPIDAANHISTIWGDVLTWWNSESVQNARSIFCENYSKTSDKMIDIFLLELDGISRLPKVE
jgi:putative transferase (TIGR04331 family)